MEFYSCSIAVHKILASVFHSITFCIINEIPPPENSNLLKKKKSVGEKTLRQICFFEADIEIIFNCAINFMSSLNLFSIQYTLVSYNVILLVTH